MNVKRNGTRIGVLALQGDFARHLEALDRLGVTASEVRTPEDLRGLSGLVLPGGESTTMLKLMDGTGMEEAIRSFHEHGGALFGTCAGLILIADRVTDPEQRSMHLLDVDVERNAYGRQADSFEADITSSIGRDAPLRGVFIRAPRVTRQACRRCRVRALVCPCRSRRSAAPVQVAQGRDLRHPSSARHGPGCQRRVL